MLTGLFKGFLLRNASKQLEESLSDQLEALVYNTVTTGNFAAFVKVFLRRSAELKASTQCEDKIFLWQTCNALTVLRFCCKYFLAKLSEDEFMKLFNRNIVQPDGKRLEISPERLYYSTIFFFF